MIVIVTRNTYLIAKQILNITLDEREDYNEVNAANGERIAVRDIFYRLNIEYVPESSPNGNINQDSRACSVDIRKAKDAYQVYKDLISQIREQMPDQLYLTKALETLLGVDDIELLTARDRLNDNRAIIKGEYDDRSTKKVRKPRKTKRTSKKVLRRSK